MTVLSDEARRKLRVLGRARTVDVKLCSKCGRTSDELPKGPHPLLEKIIQARRLLERNRRNISLSRQVNALVSQMHYSSRCCQARMKTETRDAYQPLWEMWLKRNERVPDLEMVQIMTSSKSVSASQRQKFREKLHSVDPRARITSEVPLMAPMATSREGRGPKDPDFIRMAFMLNLDAPVTKSIIRIFREEEVRQAEIAERQVPDPCVIALAG